MNLGQHQRIFVKHVLLLIQRAFDMRFEVTFGEVQRPLEMQQIYVNTGRSKTMNSMHLKKLAIDLNLFREGKICTREQIKPLGDYWESLDPLNRWGGSWRGLVDSGKSSFVDAPHFERQA
jgi:DNA-binding transcriptional ArsR family regulator